MGVAGSAAFTAHVLVGRTAIGVLAWPVSQAPGTDAIGRDALQLVLAGIFEHQSRARGEVFHRGTHQNLPCAGERADARADVDRQAADVVTGESISPVWHPARMSRLSSATAAARAWAQRTARAGPSKVASRPSPVESM
jgi:hypothetical protein